MIKLKKLEKINIAIITGDDENILLPTWDKTIKYFKKKNIIFKSLIYSRKKLGNLSSIKLYLWYLKIFKIKNFFLLVLFSCLTKITRIIKNLPISFRDLSKKNNIPYIDIKNCEEKKLIHWIKKEKIDVLLITTDDILNTKIIKSVNKGIINKHASILPTSRGLWPFFWNVINENKQGVSYHVISNKIDSGKMLFQKHLIKKKDSMIGYYLRIFNDYPFDIYSSLQILYNIKKKKLINKGNVSSYNSLPNKKDFFIFKKKGGKIITFKDIFNIFKFNK
mgnify:CR=1 FL=1